MSSGVVEFNGLRIAGLSGIYKPFDYNFGRFESPPYDENSLRSVYHIRNLDVLRLCQLDYKPGKLVLPMGFVIMTVAKMRLYS